MNLTRLPSVSSGHVGPPLPCNAVKLVDVAEMNYLAANGEGEVRSSASLERRCLQRMRTNPLFHSELTLTSYFGLVSSVGVCQRTKRIPGIPEGPREDSWGHRRWGMAAHRGHREMASCKRNNTDLKNSDCHYHGEVELKSSFSCGSRQNGCLKVIDRKKHIFKLAQGEYIAPEKIETVYNRSDPVAQIFVHGDSLQVSDSAWIHMVSSDGLSGLIFIFSVLCLKAFLVGIVVADPEYLPVWAKKKGLEGSFTELCSKKVRFTSISSPTFTLLNLKLGFSDCHFHFAALTTLQEVKDAILEDIVRLGKEAGLKSFEQVSSSIPIVRLCSFSYLIDWYILLIIKAPSLQLCMKLIVYLCGFCRWKTSLSTPSCSQCRTASWPPPWRPRGTSCGAASGSRSINFMPNLSCKLGSGTNLGRWGSFRAKPEPNWSREGAFTQMFLPVAVLWGRDKPTETSISDCTVSCPRLLLAN